MNTRVCYSTEIIALLICAVWIACVTRERMRMPGAIHSPEWQDDD